MTVPIWTKVESGDLVCQHGTAADVHCCGCHSGFLFDSSTCICADLEEGEDYGDGEDDEDLLSDWPDCHLHNGSCGKAGSEECDWECPNSRFLKS